MTRKEFIVVSALSLCGALGGLLFLAQVSKEEARIVAGKAEAARIAQAPVVRVCGSGAFVRNVEGRLHVSSGSQSGWVPQDTPADTVCQRNG